MSRAWRLGMAAGLLMATGPLPAAAAPDSGRLTVMGVPPYTQGVEAEFGLGDSPFRLGGQVLYIWNGRPVAPWNPLSPVGGREQGNAWIAYQRDLSPGVGLGALVGMHHARYERVSMPASVIEQETGGIVGLRYERTWDSVTLRLRPTLLVIPRDWVSLPWYGVVAKSAVLSGIPWVEVGYRVLPHAELSVRASLTPLALTLVF